LEIIFFIKFLAGLDVCQIGEACKRTGFDGLDVAIRGNQCVNPGNVASVLPDAVKTWADMGLSAQLVTLEGNAVDPDDATVQTIFETCGRAGMKFIKLGYWGWNASEHYWDGVRRIRAALEKFQTLSRHHGVCTLVHTHSDACYGSNASGVMHLVDGFDPQHVAVYLDPAHLAFDGEDLAMGIDIVRDYLRMIGVKNAGYEPVKDDGRTRWQKTLPLLSEGIVDWSTAIGLITAAGYEGPLCYHGEIDGYMSSQRILEGAAIDLAFLRQITPSGS